MRWEFVWCLIKDEDENKSVDEVYSGIIFIIDGWSEFRLKGWFILLIYFLNFVLCLDFLFCV